MVRHLLAKSSLRSKLIHQYRNGESAAVAHVDLHNIEKDIHVDSDDSTANTKAV